MKAGLHDLLAEANGRVKTYTVDEVRGLLSDDDVAFSDVRDEPELRDTGALPGAVHASRWMLAWKEAGGPVEPV